MDNIT